MGPCSTWVFPHKACFFFFLPPQHPKTPEALLALYDRNWQWEDKFKSALYLGAQLETNEAWLFSTLGAMSPLTPFALACAQHSSSHPIAYQHGCTGKNQSFFHNHVHKQILFPTCRADPLLSPPTELPTSFTQHLPVPAAALLQKLICLLIQAGSGAIWWGKQGPWQEKSLWSHRTNTLSCTQHCKHFCILDLRKRIMEMFFEMGLF